MVQHTNEGKPPTDEIKMVYDLSFSLGLQYNELFLHSTIQLTIIYAYLGQDDYQHVCLVDTESMN